MTKAKESSQNMLIYTSLMMREYVISHLLLVSLSTIRASHCEHTTLFIFIHVQDRKVTGFYSMMIIIKFSWWSSRWMWWSWRCNIVQPNKFHCCLFVITIISRCSTLLTYYFPLVFLLKNTCSKISFTPVSVVSYLLLLPPSTSVPCIFSSAMVVSSTKLRKLI